MRLSDPSMEEGEPLISSDEPPPFLAVHSSSCIPQTYSSRIIIVILFIVIFITTFGAVLTAIPSIRLYEDIVCHHYFNSLEGDGHIGFDGDIDEELCKGDEIQKQMNVLFGVLYFLGPIPGLLTTIPYGLLADRVGRKVVFIISVLGLVLAGWYNIMILSFWKTLPLQLIWLSPLILFIGGGEAVTSMVLYAVGSDITTEATRANVFLIGACGGLAAELFAPSVASALMIRSPWISLILGQCLIVLGASLIVFIPETLHLRISPATGMLVKAPASRDDLSSSKKIDKSTFYTTVKSQISDKLSQVKSATSVLHSLPILLLLFTFLSMPFAKQSIDLSLRYISKRFSWKLREAGFLLSLRAFINIILLFAILPIFSKILMERLGFSSRGKDLFLSRLSILVLVIGAIMIAASPTIGLTIVGLIVWTLGTGFSSLTRSLVTTLVDKEHIGRLYSMIAIIETLGALIAGPTVNGLYSLGISKGGSWIGLPYFCLAIICSLAAVALWTFGFVAKEKHRVGQQGPMPYGDEYEEAQIGDFALVGPDHTDGGIISDV
ncbi:hypothetical protein G7Y89_g1021 [Cudoniella acicularis]|uniref:Major facilitator superfamily (MFS) profile domain-containing protein n=1 Tax=Cudoniella acicularis TaxID=354080 RepID=A0A8H4RY32_9HELO|nr:hypothetical protein G7Y89_g1021 [Cudoniella acicularis]